MSAVLEIDGLSAGYDGVPVVRDLSLRVEEGQVVALLGPNGAGKTTTLGACSGLIAAIEGEVRFRGQRVTTRRPHRLARAGLAHVPEDRAIFKSLTVRQHLRVTKPKVKHASTYFPELAHLTNRRVGLLSGGEQQMVALGRALNAAPRLLIVDELSMGLAPVVVERLLPVLRAVADELGCGVLLVEQHVNQALDIADHAYVLAHGELVLEGPAAALRRDRHLITSSYLGAAPLDELKAELAPPA
jgi:branched-chain amino acid transport system ATP-binding protein